MRTRHFSKSTEIINNCDFLLTEPQEKYFPNDNPIHLEIGMGKGQFIIQIAINNPDINFIGVEKYDTIMARAIQKASEYKLPNLLFLREDAINLEKYFHERINVIYLNFSDPWPKKRHKSRRLTYSSFLDIYNKLLIDHKKIYIKTDSDLLFSSSLIELNNYGAIFNEISFDLKNANIDNVLTEYEEKFSKKGNKIYYLDCSLKRNDK